MKSKCSWSSLAELRCEATDVVSTSEPFPILYLSYPNDSQISGLHEDSLIGQSVTLSNRCPAIMKASIMNMATTVPLMKKSTAEYPWIWPLLGVCCFARLWSGTIERPKALCLNRLLQNRFQQVKRHAAAAVATLTGNESRSDEGFFI